MLRVLIHRGRCAMSTICPTFIAILLAAVVHARAGSADVPPKAPLVAVTSFAAPSLDADAQESIVSALATSLLDQGKVRVMERDQMDRILREQGFSTSGACDSGSCDVEIGKILAVDELVSGRIGRVGQTYTITARRVSVETGEVLRSVTHNTRGEIDDVLTELVPKVASDLVRNPSEVMASSPPLPPVVPVDTAPAVPLGPAVVESSAPVWPWVVGGVAVLGGGAVAAILLLGQDENASAAPVANSETAKDITVRWAE